MNTFVVANFVRIYGILRNDRLLYVAVRRRFRPSARKSCIDGCVMWRDKQYCVELRQLLGIEYSKIWSREIDCDGMDSFLDVLRKDDEDLVKSLETRRNNLSRSFFQDICKPTSCLHHLISPARDTSVTTRLESALPCQNPIYARKGSCSFINFGLYHYQPTQ